MGIFGLTRYVDEHRYEIGQVVNLGSERIKLLVDGYVYG